MRWLVWIGVTGLLCATAGWLVTDRLERDNAFCVACHLDRATPLHDRKLTEFRAAPAVSLAAAHRSAEADFRCIACHGGASAVNKLRVKTVAARDTLRWLVGRFGEPDQMRHPLWDEDCTQCHARYDPARADDYHAIEDHNVVDFAYRCVDCHLAHPSGGVSSEFAFLDRGVVLPVCRNCHEEF